MLLPDVNILIDAHRHDSEFFAEINPWLEELINGRESFGLSELVCGAFLRIVTNPRIYNEPTPLNEALTFVDKLRTRPNCVLVAPGERHWAIFTDLCREARARGNLVQDAYFAALAIESGCEWITNDGDFARFSGLRSRRPG